MIKKNLLFVFLCLVCCVAFSQNPGDGQQERSYMVNTLVKIADPVLTALSRNELKKTMPVESSGSGREQYTHLEAFGRLLSGIAPWLELGADGSAEGKLRKKYIALSRACLHNATDPGSPDYMNFSSAGQPVVDAAFLAQALLRAPRQLWDPLDDATKSNIIAALKKCSKVSHYQNNWVMFSAIIEAALYKFSGRYDSAATAGYVDKCLSYYKGDGTYGDGQYFHWDYYNSFVMQPMLIDVLKTIIETDSVQHIQDDAAREKYRLILKRAVRYAAVQEMLISPEGTYPVFGRSSAYRFGAFQLLSQITLMRLLPAAVTSQQVRAALYTVVKRQASAPGTFDAKGWLQIGVYGHQPRMGESYISTGSLYLCSEAFLLLGLPAADECWTGADKEWTSQKIWNGENTVHDHALD